jgi:hypothetical protein
MDDVAKSYDLCGTHGGDFAASALHLIQGPRSKSETRVSSTCCEVVYEERTNDAGLEIDGVRINELRRCRLADALRTSPG